jgi:anaerobic ribonucleoside-triphosphate reductase activating protein
MKNMDNILKANIRYPFIISYLDYPSNKDSAIILYLMGCEFNCKGCHNKEFQDPTYNKGISSFSVGNVLNHVLTASKINITNNVVISGGEPLCKQNLDFTRELIVALKDAYFNVCLYTGYCSNYILKQDIIGFDFVKCGKYDATQFQIPEKTNEYIKFASKNQQLFNYRLELLSKNGIFYFKEN